MNQTRPLENMVLSFPVNLELLDATDEERFIAVGMGNSGLLLVVVYTMRGDAVRLISARRATRQEAKAYEG